LLYDSSQKLIDQVGFRHGIAFPYRPYRISKQEETKHWQIPLVFSDDFLQIGKYKFVSKEKAKEIVKTLIKSVQDTNGLITFNFSISGFNDIIYIPTLIEYTIGLLKDRNTYVESMTEIINWLEKRRQVSITRQNDDFILVSFENIDRLTLSFFGEKKPVRVTGTEFFRKGDKITLKEIKRNREVIIHTALNEQKDLFSTNGNDFQE